MAQSARMTKLQTTLFSMLLALNCSCHPYAFDQPQELVVERSVTGSDFEASFVITVPKRGRQADHDGCEIGALPRDSWRRGCAKTSFVEWYRNLRFDVR
jgi:hypothetical protein